MLTTHAASFFEEEGYEILADLDDWRNLTSRQLGDIARRYAVAQERYIEHDKRQQLQEASR